MTAGPERALHALQVWAQVAIPPRCSSDRPAEGTVAVPAALGRSAS